MAEKFVPDVQRQQIFNDKALDSIKIIFSNKLADYKVAGCSFNFFVISRAFLLGIQMFKFNVHYKDGYENFKTRSYVATIKTAGVKFELCIKSNFIFFIGEDLNFCNTDKEIEIGVGINFNTPFLEFTYAKLKKLNGAILIFGVPLIGLPFFETSGILFPFIFDIDLPKDDKKILCELSGTSAYGMSFVTGGRLTPIELF